MSKWKQSRKDKNKDGPSSGKNSAPDPKSPDSSEESEFSFPILKVVDKHKNLHCYSAVLSRNSDDAISMEDLERLQPELETMLSCVAVRMRTLQNELSNFNSSDDVRLERKSTSSAKKRKISDARVSKSIKELAKVKDVVKIEVASVSSENETENSNDAMMDPAPVPEPSKPTLPENVMPNKFWAFVEPYCGDITPESLKLLQEMVASCVTDMAGVKIPSLGEHYTIKWAREDMSDEKDASSSDNKSKKKPGELSPDSKNILKNANYSLGTAKDRTTGPLVQRLVSALMEDNFSNPLQENQIVNKFDDEYFNKLPIFHTSANFEKRLRKELEVVGLLEPNSEDSDQILEDLKKCDEELKIVAKRNKDYLGKIVIQAEKEMTRQNIRCKIKAVDAELLEIYKRVNSAKSKKKQLQPKEKDQAWRALKQREALFKSLENV